MAELVYSKCKLSDLLWALGGFAEESAPERRYDTICRLLGRGRSPSEIAELLNCPKNTVEVARWRMGIRLQKHKPWSQKETQMLTFMRSTGATFSKIARALERPPCQCASKYYYEQAKKNKRPPLGQAVSKAKVHSAVAA